MLSLNFLTLFGILIAPIYYFINFCFSDIFKENKLHMAATSGLVAFVAMIISAGILVTYESSNVHDDPYKSSAERKDAKPFEINYTREDDVINISSKEIKDIIKQLEVPEERQKLIKTLKILSVGIEGMSKDNK